MKRTDQTNQSRPRTGLVSKSGKAPPATPLTQHIKERTEETSNVLKKILANPVNSAPAGLDTREEPLPTSNDGPATS